MRAVLLAALVAACDFPGNAPDPDAAANAVAVDAAAACQTPELQSGLELLASDELGGRASDTPGDVAARTYIEDAFRCAGLETHQQSFVAPDGTRAANVI